MKWKYLIILFFACSCSPNSSREFQREAEARCKIIVQDLAKVENREQLLRLEPILKKHFNSLIQLMIEVREFQQKQIEADCNEPTLIENVQSRFLEEELRRLYTIEGGREIIERAQQEALITLDAKMRLMAKRREFVR